MIDTIHLVEGTLKMEDTSRILVSSSHYFSQSFFFQSYQIPEVATELKELGSDVVTAKVDVVRYPKAASNLGIKGYPTMLLFVNGSSKTNTGGFTLQEIVTWTSKKTGESVIQVNSDILAKEFLKKYSMIVVGLFENLEGSNYEEFMKAATSHNENTIC